MDWTHLRLVVFDLDGTLYDQRCLRGKMLWELGLHCLRRPSELKILKIIAEFRRARECLAEEDAEHIGRLQFERPAAGLGIPPHEVSEVVGVWVEQRPLRHLRRCRYPAIEELFEHLRESDLRIGVLSDYPVREKLRALELEADFEASAAEPAIDRLKPNPAGLEALMARAGVAPEQCLLIGDREDRDGVCARRAGVHCLIKVRSPRAPHHFRHYRELLPARVGVE